MYSTLPWVEGLVDLEINFVLEQNLDDTFIAVSFGRLVEDDPVTKNFIVLLVGWV